MKYRVGEVQNMTDRRDSHSGFNILNSRGAPILMLQAKLLSAGS
jgi:hypothetical protein